MAFKLKTIIDTQPYFVYAFACPNCGGQNPVFIDPKDLVPCGNCGYKYYPSSFDKKYANVMDRIRRETSAKVIDF